MRRYTRSDWINQRVSFAWVLCLEIASFAFIVLGWISGEGAPWSWDAETLAFAVAMGGFYAIIVAVALEQFCFACSGVEGHAPSWPWVICRISGTRGRDRARPSEAGAMFIRKLL
jgi:hypothetical protein